ncbi:MAG: hypothetical protein Q9188_005024 [Gyalolechia gomerana]
MANASDVITYIGVPLAVLGVLPIFYTFTNSFFTLRNIKRSLSRSGSEATIRASYMGGVIEVSLPRFSITPLDRTEDEYWTQSIKPSPLKGGSWTILNWNRLITGHAMQRLHYSSDLRVPQAEVDLEELFDFLLDRGAVPDAKGIHMLRVSGLWTPTGTCVMLSPDSSQAALRVSMPDESNGILSLALQWEQGWNRRDHSSLPPGWMRLRLPEMTANKAEKAPCSDEKILTPTIRDEPNGKLNPEKGKQSTSDPSSYTPSPTSIRFNLSSLPKHPFTQIKSPIYEHNHIPLNPAPIPLGSHSDCTISWLAPLSLALSLSHPCPTIFLTLPPFLHSLSLSSSIPCGVLVYVNLLSSNDTPEWETVYPLNEHMHISHEQLITRQQAQARDFLMPEAQREQAQILRRMDEMTAMSQRAKKALRERREREEKREREAVTSQKMEIGVVVDAALGVLEEEGHIPTTPIDDKEHEKGKGITCRLAVERLLVGIYRVTAGIDFHDNEWALDACRMLERWRDWNSRGGMNRDDLHAIMKDRKAFCWAVVAVGLITLVCEKERADGGGLWGDVRECLRVWKKVRLG